MKRKTYYDDSSDSNSDDDAGEEGHECVAGLSNDLLASVCVAVVSMTGAANQESYSAASTSTVVKGSVIARTRRSVSSIMYELGPDLTRRYFRMDKEAFFVLHTMLMPAIISVRDEKISTDNANDDTVNINELHNITKKHQRVPPNGVISTEIRLAAALRYFAGGSALDIALVFGINHWDVFRSVWFVVDAINKTKKLDIKFPESHAKQKRTALRFKENSAIGIDCCVGAIDGMLIWIHRPTEADCLEMKVGPKKFYCGRKKKFALNFQGVCDGECRFIDISMLHPGATSDFLSFQTSSLFHKLEEPSFLAEGLALFGDCAYVSNSYMVTPFKAVSSGPKDAFNYYQSQVRISIECAFGMLVHRWGILRRAMPMNISVTKTCSLVSALCKLHNFCIDNRKDTNSPHPDMSAQDEFNDSANGGIPLESSPGNQYRPSQLLDGNERPTDDFDRSVIAREERRVRTVAGTIPRDKLLLLVEENNYQRVLPPEWRQN